MLGHLQDADQALALLKETWPKAEWHLGRALEIFKQAKDGNRANTA